jgi:hypothetical protein
VDGRNEDVAGFVVVELDDEFCQVGFQGGDTAFFQVFVHADFLAMDLTLTTSWAPSAVMSEWMMALASAASRA